MQNRIHKPKSYVCHGRPTPGQRRAYAEVLSSVRLSKENGIIDLHAAFGRHAPICLEIGFGSGQSLLSLAKSHPERDFIGIETHKPGIGAVCLGIQQAMLTNLRLFHGDAVTILEKCIPDHVLASVQLFFPDPWPKRRHHPRRIIQPAFIELVIAKLIPHGTIELATDWEDYAAHMMKVMSQAPQLHNVAGVGCFSDRAEGRPELTKFERRAIREGRHIRDLKFIKI